MKKLVLFALLVFAQRAFAFDLRGIQSNNEGVKRFSDERLGESYNSFVKSLADMPFQPEVHYNLGRTFFENKEYEKAYQESMVASRFAGDKNKEIKFLALFQAAAALAEQKKVDEAIEHYQQALELNPESKEAKTNIELLAQQQQGGGGGGEQQEQQKQDGDGQGQNQADQPRTNQNPDQKKQPRAFKSEELSKKDVENILDELERQEEQIRAKFQREGSKEAPKGKDW